jgi:hypothetical protein
MAWVVLVGPILFVGSCVGMLPAAARLADPMTHRPVSSSDEPFPVVVVSGETARVEMVRDALHPPEAASGFTYYGEQ